MSENKFNVIVSGIIVAFAIIFTLIIKFVAVGPAGITRTQVGFSALNDAFFKATKVNEWAYTLSNILGYIVLSLVAVYFVLAVRQIIIKKSLLKIDKTWWALAVFYVVMLAVYIIFDKIAINYRPIFVGKWELEPSYPSSHTLLALSVCFSSIIVNRTFFKDIKLVNIGNIALVVISVATVIFRLVSGYHWLTDIVGGIVITTALVTCFYTAVCYFEDKKEKTR